MIAGSDCNAAEPRSPDVVFPPSADLEEFLIHDPAAVRAGMLAVIAEEAPALKLTLVRLRTTEPSP